MSSQAQKLVLPRRLRRTLLEYGHASRALEVCGLLGGRDAELTSFHPVRNIAGDPERAFLLDPGEQIEAMRRMRDAGESLRGIFHTHPDGPAGPSATDLAMAAYPDVYYLILSLSETEPVLNAYYYDGREFTPAKLRIV